MGRHGVGLHDEYIPLVALGMLEVRPRIPHVGSCVAESCVDTNDDGAEGSRGYYTHLLLDFDHQASNPVNAGTDNLVEASENVGFARDICSIPHILGGTHYAVRFYHCTPFQAVYEPARNALIPYSDLLAYFDDTEA